MIDTWCKLLDGQSIIMEYESLVQNPQATLDTILNLCGVCSAKIQPLMSAMIAAARTPIGYIWRPHLPRRLCPRWIDLPEA